MSEPEVATPDEQQAEQQRADWLTSQSHTLYSNLCGLFPAADIVSVLTIALGIAVGANVKFEVLDVVLGDVIDDVRREATSQVHHRMMGGQPQGRA